MTDSGDRLALLTATCGLPCSAFACLFPAFHNKRTVQIVVAWKWGKTRVIKPPGEKGSKSPTSITFGPLVGDLSGVRSVECRCTCPAQYFK